MCAAPKFDTWTHEKLARAREHPSNRVERRTHVSPSSRRLATCASAASASTSTDSHRRPPWTKSWHCRTAPQTWSCTSRTTANAGACGSPSRVRNSKAPSGVSSTENPSKENANQSPQPQQKAPHAPAENVHKDLWRAPASTPAHSKSCCGIAAKELTAPVSRSQAT